MPTVIIWQNNANITTISSLHDQICNTLSKVLERWVFTFKIFKENAKPAHLDNGNQNAKFLYTEEFSYLPGKLYCLTNGSGIVMEGDFDEMLLTKLQSLWALRQTLKGEGNSYEIDNGKFILRTANVFQQGNFKGLIIELNYNEEEQSPVDVATAKMSQLLASFGINYQGEKLTYSKIDCAWTYVDALKR